MMLSDEEKKLRVKDRKDIPFHRFILERNRNWAVFRVNNNYRFVVIIAMALQFFADICCLMLSFVRGLWTSYAINPLLIILSCFGMFGAIRIEPVSLFIHAIGCYIGLFIIVVGCAEVNANDSSAAIVWALHAPGVMDLICALLTTFMASSIVTRCCCYGCCGLHRMGPNDDSACAVEEGHGNAANVAAEPAAAPEQAAPAPAPTTTTTPSGPANHAPDSQVSSSSSSSSVSSRDGDVEMKPSAGVAGNNAENFSELDDDAKMAALQNKSSP